jgi:hypothetical protein
MSSMGGRMAESEWKLFRQLQAVALERFCERVLSEVGRLAADARKNHHQRYLAVFKLIERRDKELADAFDNPRSFSGRTVAGACRHWAIGNAGMAGPTTSRLPATAMRPV